MCSINAGVTEITRIGKYPYLCVSNGEGNGNPLQYSCLGNPMDRGSWWATVHGVAESGTTEHTHTHEMGMKTTRKKHVKELARFWVTDF